MTRLKFALIGCGRISSNHIKAILDNYEDAELVCVCDILKDRVNYCKILQFYLPHILALPQQVRDTRE